MGNDVECQGQGGRREAHPKNGHIRVPNEVAEALARLPVSGSQARILWAVLRKTLGWQKSGEWKNEAYPISLADFNLTTGVSHRQLIRDINDLIRRHILLRPEQQRGKVARLSLDLQVTSWGMAKSSRVTKMSPGGDDNGTRVVTELSLPLASSDTRLKKPKETPKKPTVAACNQKQAGNAKVSEIFSEMKSFLGYPDKVEQDPIPNYGKEGQAIKRMLVRGFNSGQILECWKRKITERGGNFVSMTWVNEDIAYFVRSGEALPPKEKQASSARGRLPNTEELVRGWKRQKR